MTGEKKYTYAFKEKEAEAYKLLSNPYGVPIFETVKGAKSDARAHLGKNYNGLDVIVLDIEHLTKLGNIKTF